MVTDRRVRGRDTRSADGLAPEQGGIGTARPEAGGRAAPGVLGRRCWGPAALPPHQALAWPQRVAVGARWRRLAQFYRTPVRSDGSLGTAPIGGFGCVCPAGSPFEHRGTERGAGRWGFMPGKHRPAPRPAAAQRSRVSARREVRSALRRRRPVCAVCSCFPRRAWHSVRKACAAALSSAGWSEASICRESRSRRIVEGGRRCSDPFVSEGRSAVAIATSNRSPLTAQTGVPFPVLICGVPQIGVWRPVALYTMRRRGRVDDRPAVSGTSAVRAPTDLTGTNGLVGLFRGRTATGGLIPAVAGPVPGSSGRPAGIPPPRRGSRP